MTLLNEDEYLLAEESLNIIELHYFLHKSISHSSITPGKDHLNQPTCRFHCGNIAGLSKLLPQTIQNRKEFTKSKMVDLEDERYSHKSAP